MPTYAELNQEKAYRDEYMTDAMEWACDEIARGLVIPRVNVGAKGDNKHLNGGHRSQRWILTSKWCTNRRYTVWDGLPEELMDALGAMDITPLSRDQMLLISRRIDRAMRDGLIEEVVAYYGNTDGDNRVDGWDNIRNALASSDSSHLWHVHLTFNRWAVAIWEVMQRLVAILLGRPLPTAEVELEEDMRYLAQHKGPDGTVDPGVYLFTNGKVRGVKYPESVRALQGLKDVDDTFLSGVYEGAGNRVFASKEHMMDVLGE
jgi:hypothetical protein